MHTERTILLVVLLTLNCLCANTDVWELFGPKLKSGRSLETENKVHDYVKDLTRKFEYPLEVHKVISEQGYILTLHRLPFGRKASNITKRPKSAVLLNLGLFGSPESFLFRGPQYDLPYMLADSGYDMWILSNRGSTYSKQHVSLNPERDKSYWNFSFHEIALYDIPPVIDYILRLTKQRDLFFIGYSMGASIGHILCSSKPEYNTKIRHFINFAPVTNIIHFQPPGQNIIFSIIPDLARSLKSQNISEIFPRRVLTGSILKSICQNGSNLQPLCIALIFLIVGVDYKQFNPALFPRIFQYFPDGASLKTIEHYVQIATTGIFKEYDYGTEENRLIYRSDEAPKYNLSRVTVPTSIYYGAGDIITTKADCEYLAKKLPTTMGLYRVPFRNFNHMDFMWATETRQLLYDPLLNLLNKYK